MRSTKRLIVLTIALLGVEGAVGSALAGVYLEGDMDAAAAILTVIVSIIVTFSATVYGIMVAADKARQSKNRMARALGQLIYQDTHGATPVDPGEVLEELSQNVKTLTEQNTKLIELFMTNRANDDRGRW